MLQVAVPFIFYRWRYKPYRTILHPWYMNKSCVVTYRRWKELQLGACEDVKQHTSYRGVVHAWQTVRFIIKIFHLEEYILSNKIGTTKQEVHRPGAFKQVNKLHKMGRHRSKGSINSEVKGKILCNLYYYSFLIFYCFLYFLICNQYRKCWSKSFIETCY